MKRIFFTFVAILCAITFTACGDKALQDVVDAVGEHEQTPGEVVTEIFTALSDGDIKTAIDMSCTEGKLPTVEQKNTTIKALEQTRALFKGVRVEIVDEKIKDNTARIKTKIKMGTETKDQELKGYKIDGKWYIEL